MKKNKTLFVKGTAIPRQLLFIIIASFSILTHGSLEALGQPESDSSVVTIENRQFRWACLYNAGDNNARIGKKSASDRSQHWELKDAGKEGTFYIVNQKTGKVLAATGKNAYTTETYKGKKFAMWEFLDAENGEYYIRNLQSRRYLRGVDKAHGDNAETVSNFIPSILKWKLQEVDSNPVTPPTPPAPPSNGKSSNATLIFNNGFESNLNAFGKSLNGGTFDVVSSPVAEGKKAARLDLKYAGKKNFRAELTTSPTRNSNFDSLHKEYWFSFKFRYENWDYDPVSEIAPFQVYQNPVDWGPFTKDGCPGSAWSCAPFLMASNKGKMMFITYGGKKRWESPLEKKKWYTVTCHFRLSDGSDGFIEAWIDGKKIFNPVTGRNIRAKDNCGNPMAGSAFLKFGVYKWDWKRKASQSNRRTIFIDSLRTAKGSNAYELVTQSAPQESSSSSSGSETSPEAPPTNTQPKATNPENDSSVVTIENGQFHWACLYNAGDNNARIGKKSASDRSQHWELKDAGKEGTFYIVNQKTGKALVAPGRNAYTDGNYKGKKFATWEFLDAENGEYYIRNLQTKQYLRGVDRAHGDNAQTLSNFIPKILKWKFEGVASDTPASNDTTSTKSGNTSTSGTQTSNANSNPVAPPTPPAPPSNGKSSNATLIFNNGFESNLNAFGKSLNGGTFDVVSSPVAEGKKAARLDLKYDAKKKNFRAELTTSPTRNSNFDSLHKEYWFSFKFQYENWDYDPVSEIAPFQVYQNPVDWGPFTKDGCPGSAWSCAPFLMASNKGNMMFITYGGKKRWEAPLQKKKWYTVTCHFRLSDGNDGFIEAWIDGKKLFNPVTGRNIRAKDNCGNPMAGSAFLKFGVYKWDWKGKASQSTRRTILIDALRTAQGSNAYELVTGQSVTATSSKTTSNTASNTTSSTNTSSTSSRNETPNTQYSQYCILKADDFGEFYPSSKEWKNYVNFINLIKKKNIVASLGIVGNSVDKPSSSFVAFVKDLQKSGHFEFWNHGYDHGWDPKDAEFVGKSYNYQFQKMNRSQQVVRQYFGITMHTFGAPGNVFDATTAKVIRDIPEMKVWLYNGNIAAPAGKLGIPERTNMEWVTNNQRRPSFDRFKKEYNPNRKVLLCQMHPLRWYDNKSLPEFERIVDFLLSKKVKFILPYEYYKLLYPEK